MNAKTATMTAHEDRTTPAVLGDFGPVRYKQPDNEVCAEVTIPKNVRVMRSHQELPETC